MTRKLVARANVLTFGGLIVFLALLGSLIWDQFAAARASRQLMMHTYEVLGTIRDLGIVVREAETSQRDYLLTGHGSYLTTYETAQQRSFMQFGELQRLTVDNAAQQARLEQLAPAWQQRLQQLSQMIQVRRDKGLGAAVELLEAQPSGTARNRVEEALVSMTADERVLLTGRQEATATRGSVVRLLMLAATAIAILALLWAARLLNQAYSRFYKAEADQLAMLDS